MTYCPICLDIVQYEHEKVTDCGHIFHENCLNTHLLFCSCCPCCRALIEGPFHYSPWYEYSEFNETYHPEYPLAVGDSGWFPQQIDDNLRAGHRERKMRWLNHHVRHRRQE